MNNELPGDDQDSLDFVFPPGLHPALKGLAWMVGHWEGYGHHQWPGSADRRVLEQIDFAHNGEPFLHYLLQVFADDEGEPGEPIIMESGFWVPGEGNAVMAVIANPEGVAQSWHGTVTGLQSAAGGELATRIELTTDAVLSQGTHTAGSRLYGKVGAKLMFACDRADSEVALQPWLTGELERR